MKHLKLILVLFAWVNTAFAVSTTVNNHVIGKTLKVGSEYVQEMSKVDGSFESGTTGWVASVGTITQTASTEYQGAYKGVWSATGVGNLDLQWTATAYNTYEASAIVSVNGADSDHYVCAVVNGIETGCKLFDGSDYTVNKQIKVSVIADSVKGASFYLRIKHTGADAFLMDIDNAKIEPWTPQTVQTVEQEGALLSGNDAGTISIGSPVQFKNAVKSSLRNLGNWNGTVYTALTKQQVKVDGAIRTSLAATGSPYVFAVIGGVGRIIQRGTYVSSGLVFAFNGSVELDTNDTLYITHDGGLPLLNSVDHTISITAIASRDNVVQTWQDGMNGWSSFTPTSSWSSYGTHTGRFKKDGDTLEAQYSIALTNTPSGALAINLPSGLVADTTKMVSNVVSINGELRDVSVGVLTNLVVTYSGGSLVLSYKTSFSSGDAVVSPTTPASLVSGDSISFSIRIPILGWSSSPTLLALPTSKDNNKTYDQSLVSVNGSGWTTTKAVFRPIRTISKVTGLPVWALDFNIYGTTATSVSSVSISVAGVTFSGSYQAISASAGSVASSYALNGSVIGGTGSIQAGISVSSAASWAISGTAELASKPTWADAWNEPSVFISNINPDGFNKTSGQVGLVESFSFSFGTTNATTVCSASPCSYLDQIGNNVTSVTRASAGTYAANLSKTFAKLKCSLSSANGTAAVTLYGASSSLTCTNCSSLPFTIGNQGSGTQDVFGTFLCQGY